MRDSAHSGRIVVIGGGRMGEALASGWVSSGAVEPSRISIAEPKSGRREELAAIPGISLVGDAALALPADIVVLAVKPQVIETVVSGLSAKLSGTLVVSIAAGVSTARLESLLPSATSVVRVMPNTPALVGEGMAVVSGGEEASAAQVEEVRALFHALGGALVVDERYQNAATAISGSGPAYFALVVDALSRAGVEAGLTRQVAQELAIRTMRGTAALLSETGMHPEMLVDAVSSPGGTTIVAVNRLEAAGLRSAFADAVAANIRRAEELGSQE